MKSIKKNFVYQMIYRILTVITPIITAPILSRALGAESLGIYSASLAYISYFTMFALLGVEAYGNRMIARENGNRAAQQKLFWNIYTVQFCATIIASAAYAISFCFLREDRHLIGICQGVWLISSLLDINWFFFGCEEFRLTVTRNIAVKFLTVIGVILLVKTPNDLLLYTLLMAGGMACSQVLLWISLRKFLSFERPTWACVRPHIAPILKLFIPVLAMSVFHIMDKTMLDVISTEENVGFYYSADKIINIPLGVVCAISTVMLPRMANVLHNGTKASALQLLKKSSELIIFLTCILGFGIGAIAKEFVPTFFGAGYDPCVWLIQIFVPVLFIKAFSDMIRSQYLIPAGKDRAYIIAVLCGTVANLIANYFLIKQYQAAGAVWGTMIAEATVLIVQLWATRKEVPFIRYFCRQWCYVLYGIAMFLSVRCLAGVLHINAIWKLIIMIIVGGLVYMMFCIATWHFNKNSIFHGWQKAVRNRLRPTAK